METMWRQYFILPERGFHVCIHFAILFLLSLWFFVFHICRESAHFALALSNQQNNKLYSYPLQKNGPSHILVKKKKKVDSISIMFNKISLRFLFSFSFFRSHCCHVSCVLCFGYFTTIPLIFHCVPMCANIYFVDITIQPYGSHHRYNKCNIPTDGRTASCRPTNDEEDEYGTYTLTFNIEFNHDNDTVYFSHSYPYTYSDLQVSFIESIVRIHQNNVHICYYNLFVFYVSSNIVIKVIK